MEQRLLEASGEQTLQVVCQEKDKVISTLELEVEEQLEIQNQHLREQNQKCNEQLELLRNRFGTPTPARRGTSTEDSSSRGSCDERVESDDNSIEHRLAPPRVRIERKKYDMATSLASSDELQTSPPQDGSSPASSGESPQPPLPPPRTRFPTSPRPRPRQQLPNNRPPTPPLHRFPSWESRIYEVAVNGITMSADTASPSSEFPHPPSDTASHTAAESPNNNSKPRETSGVFADFHVPVYATVKGRASQIRSVPFTGESSDSSDNEDPRGTTSSSHTTSDSSTGSPGKKSTPKRVQQSQCTVQQESLEKCGYLTKLGSGKFKTWRRRWFVLQEGVLSYYKAPGERRPQGQLTLDETCRIVITYNNSIQAVSNVVVVAVLQNVLRRNATRLLLGREDNKPAIEGWLTKVPDLTPVTNLALTVKHGHSRRCWCVLIGRMFLYFKTPNDQVNMRDARVEEVLHMSDSDEEEEPPDQGPPLTLGIFPSHQGPLYLLMSSQQEMDSWLYHLTVVSAGNRLAGTQFETLVSRLMEHSPDPDNVLWRHPLLLHSKECISQPLTSLPSETLQSEAIKLFKSIQLFTSVALDTSGIEYHVALAQNSLQTCLVRPELQNELMCQLIKQTSRQCHSKLGMQQILLCATQSLFLCDTPMETKPLGGEGPAPFVLVQGWQLLALALALFVPRGRTLWLLRAHLRRHADPSLESGKYAIFCERALARILVNGPRECKPSRMEALSILLKNPFHHSLPHSIPVHLLNNTYQVVGFDGSTTVEEFVHLLSQELGVREAAQSGFALFSDDPVEKDVEHSLQPSAKLPDVISRWEQVLREKHLGKFETTRVIKLTFKNRLSLRQLAKAEPDKEKLLTVYQLNQEMVEGHFPLTRELALELTALISQMEFADCDEEKVSQAVARFLPSKFRSDSITTSLVDKWTALRGRAAADCARIYLNCARKWPLCGARLFPATVSCVRLSS
ncbi:PLEKHH2 [Cordylochernes scorpioides]|uniref:PLEKHH2 n=1 Tax=Cordylochernes scorpioides TaxID=51811 RepID=A0ABY6L185_9ARAC|nr:PLEKHH2 [Cordylochernes scorpioides]